MENKKDLENAGVMDLIGLTAHWVLFCTMYGKIVTVSSAGMNMGKNYAALSADALDAGVRLTYAKLSAGVAAAKNTAWKGWSVAERRGYGLLELMTEVRLSELEKRFATMASGGKDGRGDTRAIYSSLCGGQAHLKAACARLHKEVNGLAIGENLNIGENVVGSWDMLCKYALARKQKAATKAFDLVHQATGHSEYPTAALLIEAAVVSEEMDALTTGYSKGEWIEQEDVSEAIAAKTSLIFPDGLPS